jgi:serine/threonine-protein kinase
VIRTDPAADTVRPKGSAVTVVVSTGPSETNVTDVVGQTEGNARTLLEQQGFVVLVEDQPTDDPTQDGRVVDQNPDGNTMARTGSNVTIFVGRFTPPTTGG